MQMSLLGTSDAINCFVLSFVPILTPNFPQMNAKLHIKRREMTNNELFQQITTRKKAPAWSHAKSAENDLE